MLLAMVKRALDFYYQRHHRSSAVRFGFPMTAITRDYGDLGDSASLTAVSPYVYSPRIR